MNTITQLEITSDFDKFKIGLVNRITKNYENTIERQLVIDKIPNVTIMQAIKHNAFCKEILPILWDAKPPQDEKDYCYNSQTVCINIISEYNKELRVKSYFHGNIKGNPIKGQFLQSEINKITSDNIIDIVKETAIREIQEESNIKLIFSDNVMCLLNLYNTKIIGNYKIIIDNKKHNIIIKLSNKNYKLLKKCFYDNLEEHKTFMENTGEISALIL